jgi:hypothetical protein
MIRLLRGIVMVDLLVRVARLENVRGNCFEKAMSVESPSNKAGNLGYIRMVDGMKETSCNHQGGVSEVQMSFTVDGNQSDEAVQRELELKNTIEC